MTEAAAEERAADFVRRFAEFWSAPSPNLLAMLLADDVRLVAPMTPVTHTLAEGERAFGGIFDLVLGMDRWALRSQQSFSAAQAAGRFDAELVTLQVRGRKLGKGQHGFSE